MALQIKQKLLLGPFACHLFGSRFQITFMMYPLAREEYITFMDYKESFICLITMKAVILFQTKFSL